MTGTLTTDHPASSYGQPVLSISEWGGGAMDYANWILAGCEVVDITVAEAEAFQVWTSQFPLDCEVMP